MAGPGLVRHVCLQLGGLGLSDTRQLPDRLLRGAHDGGLGGRAGEDARGGAGVQVRALGDADGHEDDDHCLHHRQDREAQSPDVEVGEELGARHVAEGEDEQGERDVLHARVDADLLSPDQHRHDQGPADAAELHRADPKPADQVAQSQAREDGQDRVLTQQTHCRCPS